MENAQTTKIEWLLMVLVVGILGVMAVLSIAHARSSARDAVRLSDVRQTQLGLELFFNDFNTYPVIEALPLGVVGSVCLDESGFSSSCSSSSETIYIESIGAMPSAGVKDIPLCNGTSDAYCYMSNGSSYRIQFSLENENTVIGLPKGLNCATEYGYEPGACTQLIAGE